VRSSSQPPRSKAKSVAFDLRSEGDGYETDDSSSTAGPHGRGQGRHHRRRRSSSVPQSGPRYGDGRDSEDSGSTVDLPDRFDSQGRPLQEKDPAIDTIVDLVDRFTKVLF
jgi:hypothetical protein